MSKLRARRPLADRLWEKVERHDPDECWPWKGTSRGGYGMMRDENHRAAQVTALVLRLDGRPLRENELALHKCDNPSCCNPRHLFGGTHRDNMRDMFQKDRRPSKRGAQHWHAKLTDDDVALIRTLISAGIETRREIAVRYGITYQHACAIARGTFWKHVA